jgi:hypothetical protein
LAGLAGLALKVTAHRAGTGWPAVRGWALMSVALLGAVPAVGVMYGIRHTADSGPTDGTKGEQTGTLVALRRLLQSLPAGSAHSRAAQLAPQTVLIFGGAGSAIVALAYGPASTALKARALRLCDELFPLYETDEAAAILNQAEYRNKLEQFLGVDRSIVADLQTGLAILSPLIASAAAAFLPH